MVRSEAKQSFVLILPDEDRLPGSLTTNWLLGKISSGKGTVADLKSLVGLQNLRRDKELKAGQLSARHTEDYEDCVRANEGGLSGLMEYAVVQAERYTSLGAKNYEKARHWSDLASLVSKQIQGTKQG